MASSASASYPVRLTGAPPAPSSTSTSSSRKKKSPPPPPPLQRHTLTITPTLTLPQLRLDATRLFGVELADYDVELLTGFPPKKLEVPEEKNGFGEEVLVKDWVGRNEVVTVRFVPCAGNGGAAVGNGNGGSRSGNKKSKAAPKAKRGTAGGKGKKRSRPAVAAAAAAADGNSSDEYEYNDSIGATAGASPSRRSKRAASAAAAAAMPDVIAAQDKLMREQGLTSNRSTKRRKSSGGKKSSGTGIGGSSAAASSAAARAAAAEKRAAAAASRKMAAMPGRRLGDGAGVAPTASAAAAAAAAAASAARKSTAAASAGGGGRKKATNLFGQMSSEEDVSYALMNSLSSGGGGSGGKVGKVLRTAMRGAIGKAYEASRAVVRVDAVRGQNFALVPKGTEGGGRLGGAEDGGSTASHVGRYVVTYSKGVEGRGQYEEDVEIIALEALRAVVGAVHADNGGGDGQDEDGAGGDTSGGGGGGGREMLRPASMAQLSPRVFWSLAHHFPGRSTEEALRALLPDLDWSFLEGRSRMLSEKARENLRQEKVARGEIVDDQEEGNPEAMGEYAKGVEAVEEVERAMGEMAERDRTSARDRAARAALARFGGDTDGEAIPASSQAQQQQKEEEEAWTLITPTDEDEDELAECIREGFASAEPTLEPSKSDVKTWTSSLMQKYSVHNWRQLANVSEGAEMVSSLEVLGARPTEDDVERWIESARARTIEEIMLEIVGGNEEAFVALRDGARAGTPKDLYAWRAVSDMLLEEILGYAGADAKGTTAQDVQRWCARAGVALKEAPWLEWYATPVI